MAITMTERVNKVSLVMKKYGIPDWLKAQVKFELDVSGSAEWMYNNGMMQELMERLMAVALRLDADGKLELSSFSSKAHKHGDVTEAEIVGYIKKKFIPEAEAAGTWMGGTHYARAIYTALHEGATNAVTGAVAKAKSMFSNMFKKAELVYPNIHWFVSDGKDDGPREDFLKLLREAKDTDYFVLVGVGEEHHFGLMKDAAELYDNVGFAYFPDLSISDDAMYQKLIAKEALDWLLARQPKQQQ